MKSCPGYTIIELGFALMLGTLLMAMAVAPIAHARDVLAVRGARSELAGLFALTRSTAVAAGGATLIVDVEAGSAWIENGSGTRVGDMQHISTRHHVALASSRTLLTIRYDGLGIGRMSNAVVTVTSGSVTGTITISAYGRVRQS